MTLLKNKNVLFLFTKLKNKLGELKILFVFEINMYKKSQKKWKMVVV